MCFWNNNIYKIIEKYKICDILSFICLKLFVLMRIDYDYSGKN